MSRPPPLASDPSPSALQDYNLTNPLLTTSGLRQGLTSYGDAHFSLFLRKVFIKALGYSEESLSLPIIGIINTYSALNPCHSNVPQLIESCKRGIHLKGGLAVEFPTISIAESFASPTSMFLRNLMAMDTEEMVRCQPIDAVVMIGGCDKTLPAQLMGGISANKPMLPLITGPMMPGSYRGVRLGACTDCRSNWAAYRAGTIEIEDISALNEELAPTGGTCGVMGTASTMACITAGLGLIPLLGASAPAVSSLRLRIAEQTGSAALHAISANLTPQSILTKSSFHNAIVILQAIGGSTNAIVHLLAIINRHPLLQNTITLHDIDLIGRRVPLLVDLKPSGDNYMTDFHNAGGMMALLHVLRPLLHLDAMTITGQTLGEVLDASTFRTFEFSEKIIRSLDNPLYPASSLVVLYGNLAPKGCVMKASASKYRHLLQHRGPAVVFKNTHDMALRIDSDELEVTKDSILILQGIGPVGNPGMPEAGLIPIPRKLAREGVLDMLHISDGRMSGTAGGTIVLHVSPESVVPGSLFGLVRDGDIVWVDVEGRGIGVEIGDEEVQRRLEEKRAEDAVGEGVWEQRASRRGYRGLYERCVNQAEEGADFDFLTASGPGAGGSR